ncbi:MAG: glutamate--tRNA ligase, partial [Zetaproteobacteria bacterium]
MMRTRFAPSPTGPLHLGGARTAILNFLAARQAQGVFLLRFEDTDPQRAEARWQQTLREDLMWLGLRWEE